MLGLAGVGIHGYLTERWPDRIAIYEAIALEADKLAEERAKMQATMIANAVAEMLDKSR